MIATISFVIFIILLSCSFNFNFVHTYVICRRSILKYNIISETWFVSISLCPGMAQGAWKHAPIIPLPNYHALMLHAHPTFLSSKLPPVNVLVD